jgi:transcription antitermination protein NusB
MTTRHDSREMALQILYSCEISGAAANEAIAAYFAEHSPDASAAVRAFASALVLGTLADVPSLDALIAQHSRHWRLARLAIIDRLVLRMAVWELQHEPDLPPAVVLNEALELARTFSTDGSVAFVNGVLDGIRKTLEGPGPEAPDLQSSE